MNATHPALDDIAEFLAQRRIALVGASFEPRDFSRAVMRTLLAAGYDVVPVNARGVTHDRIEGCPVFAHIGDIAAAGAPVTGALLMVPRRVAAEVVAECARAGVGRVWLHRGAGHGVATPEALQVARDAGLRTIAGECPLMFLPHTQAVHRMHGGLRKLRGRWPPLRLGTPEPGRRLVLAMLLVALAIAFPALGGGVMLAADPTGDTMGAPAAWLAHAPFGSYLIPGLVLAALGLGHLASAFVTFRHRPAAGGGAVLMGLAMLGYIAGEWLWLPHLSFLQFGYAALGVLEITFGFMWLRHLGPRLRPLLGTH